MYVVWNWFWSHKMKYRGVIIKKHVFSLSNKCFWILDSRHVRLPGHQSYQAYVFNITQYLWHQWIIHMFPRECVVMCRSRFGIDSIRPVLVQFWCMFTGLFRFDMLCGVALMLCVVCLYSFICFYFYWVQKYWISHQLASIACHATHRQSASSLTYGVLIKTTQPWLRSMGVATPLLTHWSYHGYHSLALSRRENGLAPNHWWPLWPLMTQFTDAWNYSDATMSTMASQITSLTIVYPTVYSGADQRKKIKAPRHWPLCGEFTGDQWIPRTKGQ